MMAGFATREVDIRRMSVADVPRVLDIAAGLKDAPHWPESAYLAALEPANGPRRIALVAERTSNDAQEVVGFLVAVVVAPEAEIETVAVSSDLRRQGIGNLLLDRLIQELETERVNKLILEVRDSNQDALQFYRSNMFNRNGKRLRYYADPEEDAVLMERVLVG